MLSGKIPAWASIYLLPEAAALLPSVWAVSLPSFCGQAPWHPAAVPEPSVGTGCAALRQVPGELPAWRERVPQRCWAGRLRASCCN